MEMEPEMKVVETKMRKATICGLSYKPITTIMTIVKVMPQWKSAYSTPMQENNCLKLPPMSN